jgi:two-component system, LuxR family, sensor kinase FixL
MNAARWRAPADRWRPLASSTTSAVIAAGLLIAAIALVDRRVNLSFGLFYVFPIILLGTVLPRWHVVLVASLCTWLTDLFNPFPFVAAISIPQDVLVFAALAGTGIVAYELTRSRRREIEQLRAVEREMAGRRGAEEQVTFLINTSPAAIMTMSAGGEILLANAAAHRLFGVPGGQLAGRMINRYLPALGCVPADGGKSQVFQTDMQCRGEREHGEVFLATVFFSTYDTTSGPRLAAMVLDTSADLLEREESNLEQLLAGSRVLVAAVSHEVRNLCSAMAIIHENLARHGSLSGDKDFDALGTLVDTLTRIASVQLTPSAERSQVTAIDLVEVLGDVRMVLEPYCEEAGISVHWQSNIPYTLPAVWADRHHLLQALLNLAKNSQRALEGCDVKNIVISVSVLSDAVSIRVTDSGPGPAAVDNLFQPFQKGADATGLGLYLSRALLRSFRGDLRYDPSVPGCSFVIDLAVVASEDRIAVRAS